MVTAELGSGATNTVLDVEVDGLSGGTYRATFTSPLAKDTPLRVTVGAPEGSQRTIDAVAGADLAATAQALSAAAQAAQPPAFLAATDGTSLLLASLIPGIDGALSLEGPVGTRLTPASEESMGKAAFIVNQVATPLLGSTVNRTSPIPGVTLTAHSNGRARVTVGAGVPSQRMPGAVLVVAILWIGVLGVIGLQYPHIGVRWFGDHNYILKYAVPRSYGPIPGSVPWFAAVGGLLISLQGIFTHNRSWDRSYDYWHYLRPVAGALVGTVAALLVLVLISTANASNNTSLSSAASNSQSTRILLAAVAVLVGYREETFRSLIARVVDVIIGPGGSGGSSSTSTSGTTSGTKT